MPSPHSQILPSTHWKKENKPYWYLCWTWIDVLLAILPVVRDSNGLIYSDSIEYHNQCKADLNLNKDVHGIFQISWHPLLFSFLSSFLHSILPVFLSRQNLLLCNPRLASNACLSLLSNSWEFRCVPRPSLTCIFFCEGSEHPCSMIDIHCGILQIRKNSCVWYCRFHVLKARSSYCSRSGLALDRWKLRLPRICPRKALDSLAFWGWVRMMGLFCTAEETVICLEIFGVAWSQWGVSIWVLSPQSTTPNICPLGFLLLFFFAFNAKMVALGPFHFLLPSHLSSPCLLSCLAPERHLLHCCLVGRSGNWTQGKGRTLANACFVLA